MLLKISQLVIRFSQGYETTATAIMNIYTLLAMYPEYQEKLYQEFVEFGVGNDEEVTLEHLGKMKYLDAYLNECLRYLPVVPLVTRLIKKDMFIGSINSFQIFFQYVELHLFLSYRR